MRLIGLQCAGGVRARCPASHHQSWMCTGCGLGGYNPSHHPCCMCTGRGLKCHPAQVLTSRIHAAAVAAIHDAEPHGILDAQLINAGTPKPGQHCLQTGTWGAGSRCTAVANTAPMLQQQAHGIEPDRRTAHGYTAAQHPALPTSWLPSGIAPSIARTAPCRQTQGEVLRGRGSWKGRQATGQQQSYKCLSKCSLDMQPSSGQAVAGSPALGRKHPPPCVCLFPKLAHQSAGHGPARGGEHGPGDAAHSGGRHPNC